VKTQLGTLELDDRFSQLATDLTRSFEGSLAETVSRLQEEGKAELSSAVDAVRTEIAAARDTALNEALDRVDSTAAELKDAIAGEAKRADTALTDMEQRLRDELGKSLVEAVTALEATLTASIDDAVQKLETDLAAVRDSVTADFEAQLEKSQETLTARIDSTAKSTLASTQTMVTNLETAITPRLDNLEVKVLTRVTTDPTLATRITTRPGG
jgi:DNA anti-recombination protein RmuC